MIVPERLLPSFIRVVANAISVYQLSTKSLYLLCRSTFSKGVNTILPDVHISGWFGQVPIFPVWASSYKLILHHHLKHITCGSIFGFIWIVLLYSKTPFKWHPCWSIHMYSLTLNFLNMDMLIVYSRSCFIEWVIQWLWCHHIVVTKNLLRLITSATLS